MLDIIRQEIEQIKEKGQLQELPQKYLSQGSAEEVELEIAQEDAQPAEALHESLEECQGSAAAADLQTSAGTPGPGEGDQ